MDKKIKSSFTQMVSDPPNDTDPVGGKMEQVIPVTGRLWGQEKMVEDG